MLKQDVIEPAISPWASNIVLAKKKDGSLRCCIDFRQVNELTKKDAYPLPRTDACLDAMSGSCFFTTIDLKQSYHQVAMWQPDADKTAFITRSGMFRFKTMPFGLCNAGATFQRLMDLVLTGLNLEICLAYLDDIIIYSSTPEEHLNRLEQVLERLQQANLKLKPSKCRLMQREVVFLGHVVFSDGIATDPEKIRLINEWPRPTNLKQLRGFLGLTGYYRKFVQGYAKIAAPLNFLTRKNHQFVWTSDCQEAFEKLKEILTSPPILAMPNDDGMFIVDTDAAEHSIGCVLSQVQNGQERVIAYAGRVLSKNEVNYCVTRKELLAIVYFTRHFRQYVLGRQFVIRTDHAALSWLKKTPEPLGQNARWLELLGEYDYVIQHRPGVRHGNADAVSRHPRLNKPSCTACHSPSSYDSTVERNGVPCAEAPNVHSARVVSQRQINGRAANTASEPMSQTKMSARAAHAIPGASSQNQNNGRAANDPDVTANVQSDSGQATENFRWTNEQISSAQRDDPEIGVIISFMEESQEKPFWKDVELQSSSVKSLWNEWQRLEIRNGVLCRRWISTDELQTRYQVILPHAYRTEFIQMAYSGINGGHLGRSKTEEQVKLRAYWPNWRQQVSNELKRCVPCAQYHRGKAPRQSPLNPFLAGEPFEVVAVDITGKHPRSSRGNEYIITVIDIFSKWAEAYPVTSHTAPVVARTLMNNFFSRYGMPKRLLTDQGKQFESQLFKELCKRMEIEKIRTSPYKPSTNGYIERFHRTLNSMLAKVVAQNQRDWDEKLPSIMAAYRAAKHESTGYTPNFLVLSRENRAPVDLVLGAVTGEEEHYESLDDYVCEMQRRLRDSYALAREHLDVAAERRKNEYDVKVKDTQFDVGQAVWYFYPRRYTKRSPKWCSNYDGPFRVVKVIPPCDYVIQKSRKSKPQVVHGDKLKPCRSEAPPFWLQTDDLDQPDTAQAVQQESTEQPVSRRRRSSPEIYRTSNDGYDGMRDDVVLLSRPRRSKKVPDRFRDFKMPT